ncbi:MAG TPA: carboxylating nicotinate-nucleotide diphosphorylase [Syntrophaceae bacterium]|jgi:nicotinate-nucleotide pyrophosphorylase (carboxylating)|nr:carboxylating nicotinate-nucleotide diphosphorylase [Syntrophaceae bacterium]
MFQTHIIHKLLQSALEEDVGTGDITTTAVLTGNEVGKAKAIAKADLVVAGIDIFRESFLFVDSGIRFTAVCEDGHRVEKGGILAEIYGNLGSILTAERVALNFLQRMCGIATLTRKYVDEIKGTRAKILDTRKTVPGLRCLDKYAVRIGGGRNHRFGLYDGVLIKDNHIAAAGSISQALAKARGRHPHTMRVEVEVKNLPEVEEALASGAEVIMLDNMTIADMRKAVETVRGKVPLEASGNVTLANVRKIAETGVDFISVGALTHSVQASDISLKIEEYYT